MKTLISHKNQAFALTCLIFSPLLAVFTSGVFKVEMKGQDSISVAMEQFVAQGEFVSPKLAPSLSPTKDTKALTKKEKKETKAHTQKNDAEKKETKNEN